MVARNPRNHANDVWEHAEVVPLCESRFEFSCFGLLSPEFTVLFTALCHSSRGGEMSVVSMPNQWRGLGKWKLKLPGTFPDSHEGYEAMGVAWEASTQRTVALAARQLLPGAN